MIYKQKMEVEDSKRNGGRYMQVFSRDDFVNYDDLLVLDKKSD